MVRSARELSDVIAEIYAASLDTTGAGWSRVCERLSHLIAAGGSVALGLQRGRLAYASSHAFGLGVDSLVRYQAYYRDVDPVFEPRLLDALPGTILLSDAIMTSRELRRTEFDADWLRPHGFGSGMAAVVLRHGSAASVVYVARPRSRGAFTREDLETFGLLLPHLAGAVRASLRLAEIDSSRHAFEAALDRWAHAVVLVDVVGGVYAANHAAERLLRAGDGIAVEASRGYGRGRLRTSSPGATRALLQLIAEAARIAGGGGDGDPVAPHGQMSLVLARPSGRPALIALVAPLGSRDRLGNAPLCDLLAEGSGAVAAVFICDLSGDDRTARSATVVLRDAFGLTASEAAVAVALAVGDGLGAVALANGVTLATVRTQAQQVYRKTGVRGQAALARLVERLAHLR